MDELTLKQLPTAKVFCQIYDSWWWNSLFNLKRFLSKKARSTKYAGYTYITDRQSYKVDHRNTYVVFRYACRCKLRRGKVTWKTPEIDPPPLITSTFPFKIENGILFCIYLDICRIHGWITDRRKVYRKQLFKKIFPLICKHILIYYCLRWNMTLRFD